MVGLAAYANLLRNANRSDEAVHYETLNKQFVEYWTKNAQVIQSKHSLKSMWLDVVVQVYMTKEQTCIVDTPHPVYSFH